MSTEGITVDFRTAEEAVATYYDEDVEDIDGMDPTDDDAGWGEPDEEPTNWEAGWTLWYQEHIDRGDRRWFVIRVTGQGQFQALRASGAEEDLPDDAAWNEIPAMDSESEARRAYDRWVDDNPDEVEGEDADEAENWGDWDRVSEMAGWHIFRRDHQTEERSQWLAAGETGEGETVYLQQDGTVANEPYIFENIGELEAALESYQGRENRGEIPENRRPTGAAPTGRQVNQDAGHASSPSPGLLGSAINAVGGPLPAVIIVAALVGGIYYADRQGHIDLSGRLKSGGSA